MVGFRALFILTLIVGCVCVAGAQAQSPSTAEPQEIAAADVSDLTLWNQDLTPTNTLVPGDTMYVTCLAQDDDGFRNIRRIDYWIYFRNNSGAQDQPAVSAHIAWRRFMNPAWKLVDPDSTTWTVIPDLCVIDSTTNSTLPQLVSLAFTPSRIARSSATGKWSIEAYLTLANSGNEPWDWVFNLECDPNLEITFVESPGDFTAGPAGATDLPISNPASGFLQAGIIANQEFHFKAMVEDMQGVSLPAETLPVESRIRFDVPGGNAGWLETTMGNLVSSGPPLDVDEPREVPIHLWIDHPDTILAQQYAGDLSYRIQPASGPATPGNASATLVATVTDQPLAATRGFAEVSPYTVVVGRVSQPFTAFLLPDIQPGDTGINRSLVSIPAGYSIPAVSEVRVGGSPVTFADSSKVGLLDVRLTTAVTSSALIEVDFTLDTPTDADIMGQPFTVLFDDFQTPSGPQGAIEGDANGLSDDDGWLVKLIPGPLTTVAVSPNSISTRVDSVTVFSATTEDSFGNPVPATISWRSEGGIGNVDPTSGVFTATTVGSGIVIAEIGGLADTSYVTVISNPEIAIRTVTGPASASQGQLSIGVQMRVENLGADPVDIDSLRLSFTLAVPGDANSAFVSIPSPSNPGTVAALQSEWFAFDVSVADTASAGDVAIDGGIWATDQGTGQPVSDVDADTLWTLEIQTPPSLAPVPATLTPALVVQGAAAQSFGLEVFNAGKAGFDPSPVSSLRILAPGDTLVFPYAGGSLPVGKPAVPLGGNGVLTFGPVDIPAGYAPGKHAVEIDLTGVDSNGKPYSGILGLTDSVTVVAAAVLVTLGATQPTAAVLPGQSESLILRVAMGHDSADPITLRSVTLANTTVGTGTQLQLDGELGALFLYLDDGDGRIESGVDLLVGTTSMTGGLAQFDALSLPIPNGAVAQLLVGVDVTLAAADGDTLDLSILDSAAFVFDETVTFANAWPVNPAGGLAINGMAAAQIGLGAHPSTVAVVGEKDVLVLDAIVPANGYLPDTLEILKLVNTGSALPGTDIERTLVWRDGGDGQFDGGDDVLLGEAGWAADKWVLAGLVEPIPTAGLRLFATADIAATSPGQTTIDVALPTLPGQAFTVRSDNEGPRDAAVGSGFTVTIQPDTTAYLSVQAFDQAGEVLLPGDSSTEIFRLRVTNHWSQPETLTTLRLTNRTQGSGSPGELDADWGPLTLGIGDGESQLEKPGLGFAAEASFLADVVTFTGLQLEIPPGDTLTLSVWGGPSLGARDGDLLDLSLEGPGDLIVSPPISLTGAWPLNPAGGFPVDGMSAGQIALVPVPFSSFPSGSQRSLALHFVLPSNGYESDVLERLNISNLGSARAGLEIEGMEAWIDEGDGSFDPATDRGLGEMTFTGNRWEITGIAEPVALAGVRVFVTVDISDLAGEGNTIRLALPTGSDLGIGMASGNDGPLDQEVANPFSQSISAADRITVTAVPLVPRTAHPGELDLPLLQLAAANSYDATKRLTSLTFTNASTGPGIQMELDGEIESLHLWLDGNDNGLLDDPGSDPLLGTAVFVGGRAVFQGLTWDIPADSVRALFLTANVSLANSRDGDVLAAMITEGSELLFEDAAAVVGSWPLDSGARYSIDGMLHEQIINLGAPVATVGPSDGPVLAMDFILPSNGYQTDELNGIQVVNRGNAGAAEIDVMRLWRDGGDGVFSAGGDDVELSSLAWTGSGWQSPFLAVTLPRVGARLFISADISSTPADSTTLRLALPLGGVQMASGNDGPIDLPVENPEAILVSSAPLLATLQVIEPASTVDRQINIQMILRNVSGEQIGGITPSALTISGDGFADAVTGPLPLTLDLAPGEADTIRWVYTARTPGEIQFEGSANGTGQPSGIPRNSVLVRSNTHLIFIEVENLALYSVESMPFSINRGQTDVVPLNLTLTNYGGGEASDVRVRGLRVHLENENGQGIVPADLLSRVVVNEGTNIYLSKTTLEPSGAVVDLTLANPVLVTSSEPVTLSLQLDILASTTVPNFRIVIPDSTQFSAEDATSGAPVDVVLEEGAYPIRSGLARLSAEAVDLQVSAVAGASQHVGAGQTSVPVAAFELLNAGIDGLSSDIRVVSLEAAVTDAAGTPIGDPSQVINRIRVLNSQQVFLDRPVDTADDTTMTLLLSPLLPVPVNLPLDLTVEVDLHEGAPNGSYRIALGDTAQFDARDANSGQRVPVLYQTTPLTGPEFIVEFGAEELRVAGTGMFPASAPAGVRALPAMRTIFSHPGPAGTARARLDGLTIRFMDEKRDALIPAEFVARVQVLEGATVIAEVLNPPTTGSSITVGLPGLMLEPGQSRTVDVLVDLQPSAPASFLELTIGVGDILAIDANTGELLLSTPDPGTTLPVTSSLMQVVTPARNLVVALESLMPAVLVRDGTETPAARITLTNSAPVGSGPIQVTRLVINAADQDGRDIAAGAVVNRLTAYHDGTPWGASGDLNADSTVVVVAGSDTLTIEPGTPAVLDLRFETQVSGTAPSLRLGLDAAGVGIEQPVDPLLFVDTEPQQGLVFPIWTQTGNFSGLSLDESYSNFPNPFAAGRQLTSFVYSLRTGAQVTLKIFTSRGEPVATVVSGIFRPSGLHQDDRWDGRNGSGKTVINGVYIAELSVQYDDGQFEKLRRKVAVLR